MKEKTNQYKQPSPYEEQESSNKNSTKVRTPESQFPNQISSKQHRTLLEHRHSWPKSADVIETTNRGFIAMTKTSIPQSGSIQNESDQIQDKKCFPPAAVPDYPLFVCNVCLKLQTRLIYPNDGKSNSSTFTNISAGRIISSTFKAKVTSNAPLETLNSTGSFDSSNRSLRCCVCGVLIVVDKDNLSRLLSSHDSSFINNSKKGKLRNRLSKLHKSFRSSFGIRFQNANESSEDSSSCDTNGDEIDKLKPVSRKTIRNRESSTKAMDSKRSSKSKATCLPNGKDELKSFHSPSSTPSMSRGNMLHVGSSSSIQSLPASDSVRKRPKHDLRNSYATSPDLGSRTQHVSSSHQFDTVKEQERTSYISTRKLSNAKIKKQSLLKKKALSSSYMQKNEDFHKLFKELPDSEELLVDYSCACVKDILVQGRLYVSQNFLCFHSNILKWQTALVVGFKDIESITKEKTVKVIPNAIQFQIKDRRKPRTFTSFTQRDRTFWQINLIWKNALKKEPIKPNKLWEKVRIHYANDGEYNSDDDFNKAETSRSEIRDLKSTPKKKTASERRVREPSVHGLHRQRNLSEGQNPTDLLLSNLSTGEDKASSLESIETSSTERINGLQPSNSLKEEEDYPVEHCKKDLQRTYLAKEFNVSAATMFETLFGDNCLFMKDYLEDKGSLNVVFGKWNDGGERNEIKEKQLNYELAVNNPLIPKLAKVKEMQVYYHMESRPCACYAVDCTAYMSGAPYTDYFYTVMRYCVRRVGSSKCELRVSASVNYNKSPWGLVKTFIEKNVASGMQDNFSLLEKKLKNYFAGGGHVRHSASLPTTPLYGNKTELTSVSRKKGKKTSSKKTSSNLEDGLGEKDTAPLQNGYLKPHVSSLQKEATSVSPPSSSANSCHGVNNSSSHIKHRLSQETTILKGKTILALLLFLFLLWNNYTVYQRLNSLEAAYFQTPVGGLNAFQEQNMGRVYGEGGSNDGRIGEYLKKLEARLVELETTIRNQMATTNKRHRALNDKMNEVLMEISPTHQDEVNHPNPLT